MTRYIAGRSSGSSPVLFVVSLLTFLPHALGPGRAVGIEKALPAPTVARLNKYGLDDPLPVQYINWATSLLRGDLGHHSSSPTAASTTSSAKASASPSS